MSNVQLWVGGISAIPGLVALVGAAVGHGRTMQRLATVERDVSDVRDLKSQVTRIDERTLNTDRNVTSMKDDLATVTEHLLSAGRSFIEQPRRARDRT